MEILAVFGTPILMVYIIDKVLGNNKFQGFLKYVFYEGRDKE